MSTEISKRTVVCSLPGMDEVAVRSEGSIDLYYPARNVDAAVIIVAGYSDAGFQRVVGCRFKEMGWTTSWCRLLAASGVAAVAYTQTDPLAGVNTVIADVSARGFARIGLLASSGNAALAASLLMHDAPRRIDCAALLYPYTLAVPADALKYGFVAPANGRTVSEMSAEIPVFVARAGHDEMPGLNDTLDAFIADALHSNLPITVMNHRTAPHAFDLVDDTGTTHYVVHQALAFFGEHLLSRQAKAKNAS